MWRVLIMLSLLGGCASASYLQDRADKAARLAEIHSQTGDPRGAAWLREDATLDSVRADLRREKAPSAFWEDVLLN